METGDLDAHPPLLKEKKKLTLGGSSACSASGPVVALSTAVSVAVVTFVSLAGIEVVAGATLAGFLALELVPLSSFVLLEASDLESSTVAVVRCRGGAMTGARVSRTGRRAGDRPNYGDRRRETQRESAQEAPIIVGSQRWRSIAAGSDENREIHPRQAGRVCGR